MRKLLILIILGISLKCYSQNYVFTQTVVLKKFISHSSALKSIGVDSTGQVVIDSTGATGAWGLNGNSGLNSDNFIGTTDSSALIIASGGINPNTGILSGIYLSGGNRGGNPVVMYETSVDSFNNYSDHIVMGLGPHGNRIDLQLNDFDENKAAEQHIYADSMDFLFGYMPSPELSIYNRLKDSVGCVFRTNIQIQDGTQGIGKVLTSDASGIANWQSPACATGATGSEPGTPYLGQEYYDTTLNKFTKWNGSVWVVITSTP